MKSPTCTIFYEKILATIHKSGLYDFIRMAYSTPCCLRKGEKVCTTYLRNTCTVEFFIKSRPTNLFWILFFGKTWNDSNLVAHDEGSMILTN